MLASYVDHPGGVAFLQVVQHGGLVEVGHHHHVLDLIVLRGVHGEHLVLPHHQCLRRHTTQQNKNQKQTPAFLKRAMRRVIDPDDRNAEVGTLTKELFFLFTPLADSFITGFTIKTCNQY